MQCLKSKDAPELHDCMNAMIRKLEWVADYKELNPDYSVPSFCCLVPSYKRCVQSRSEKVCKGSTPDPEETGEFLVDMFQQMTGAAMEAFCGRFTNEKTCREKLPEVMRAYDQIDSELEAGNFTLPKSKSYILPVVEVFSRE